MHNHKDLLEDRITPEPPKTFPAFPLLTNLAAAEEAANPTLTISQKFAALPQTTKIAVYGGAAGAGAILVAAALIAAMRARSKGRKERAAYNASIEKQRDDAYREQVELREKGLGGWDANTTQGDDALGGWGGTHATPGSQTPTSPTGAQPARSNTPGLSRMASPAPLLSPQSQHVQNWNGGNDGGMIHDAGNAYNGGYGGNTNIPRSPAPQRSFTGSSNANDGYFPPQQTGYARF